MVDGIVVYNDYGTVLLGPSAPNLALRTKGTATSYAQTGYDSSASQFTISVSGSAPMVAIRSLYYTGLFRVTYASGVWTYDFFLWGAAGTVVDYYVFDYTGWSPAVDGMNVYTDGGLLAYSTDAKTIRIEADISPPLFSTPNTGGSVTLASGRDYAVMATGPSGRHWLHISGEDPTTGLPTDKDEYRYMTDFRVNGATIEYYFRELYHNHGAWVSGDPTEDIDYVFSGGPVGIVDVTNY